MVWGFVKYDGTRGLQKISGIMSSRLYKETLVETLFPHFYLGENSNKTRPHAMYRPKQ